INRLRGNVNGMHARESMFRSKLFGDDLPKCLPVVDLDGSDSGKFDNVLELLVLAGRSLPHAMMMMIPEPWSNHESMSQQRKDFFRPTAPSDSRGTAPRRSPSPMASASARRWTATAC